MIRVLNGETISWDTGKFGQREIMVKYFECYVKSSIRHHKMISENIIKVARSTIKLGSRSLAEFGPNPTFMCRDLAGVTLDVGAWCYPKQRAPKE